jgi:hypothetical protein
VRGHRRSDWDRTLARPLVLGEGTRARTILEANNFVLALAWEIQQRPTWKEAAKLLTEAADGGCDGDIDRAALQVEAAPGHGKPISPRPTRPID